MTATQYSAACGGVVYVQNSLSIQDSRFSARHLSNPLINRDMETSPSFDPSLYPRSYPKTWGKKLEILLVTIWVVYSIIWKENDITISSIILIGCFILYCLNGTFARLILYEDRIERRTWFKQKLILLRKDIIGIRRRNSRSPAMVTRSGSALKYFYLPDDIRKDDAWEGWIKNLPDLNQRDLPRNFFDIMSGNMEDIWIDNPAIRKYLYLASLIAAVFSVSSPALFLHVSSYLLLPLPWIVAGSIAVYAKTASGNQVPHIII